MAETILCYGIKSRIGLMQIEKISFDDLGKLGYDYQVAFKTLSEAGGNGSFDLVLVKDGMELKSYEINGWRFENLHVGYDWGSTWFIADVTDCIGEKERLTIASGSGSMSSYQPTYEHLLNRGISEIKRISETYSSVCLYKLCEKNNISMYADSLYNYYYVLKYMFEFCKKAEEIRNRLRYNPDDKDLSAYNTKLKPKLIEYMEKLSNVKINPDSLNI